MKKGFKLAAGVSALALSLGAQAGIIDLFSTSQARLDDDTNGGINVTDSLYSQVGGVADSTIIGGYRDLWVTSLNGAEVGATETRIGVNAGTLKFSSDTGVTGVGEVQWDGNDSAIGTNPVYDVNPIGLQTLGIGIDLTAGGGLNTFQVTTLFSDQGWSFLLTMYKDALNYTSISLDANSVGFSGADFSAPHVSYVPFAAFSNPLFCGTYGAAPGVNAITCFGTGADPTNVGALVARLNVGDPLATNGLGSAPIARTIALDLELDSITTIPEPGTLALLGASLLAVVGLGRRRKNAA